MEKPYDNWKRYHAVRGLCAAVALILLSGCAAEDATHVRAQKQLATLERIEALERDTAAFAASRRGIRDAEAYIRENSAVVLLSPAERASVPAQTIAEISAYIAERTGLAEDRITIKMRSAPTRGTTP